MLLHKVWWAGRQLPPGQHPPGQLPPEHVPEKHIPFKTHSLQGRIWHLSWHFQGSVLSAEALDVLRRHQSYLKRQKEIGHRNFK